MFSKKFYKTENLKKILDTKISMKKILEHQEISAKKILEPEILHKNFKVKNPRRRNYGLLQLLSREKKAKPYAWYTLKSKMKMNVNPFTVHTTIWFNKDRRHRHLHIKYLRVDKFNFKR